MKGIKNEKSGNAQFSKFPHAKGIFESLKDFFEVTGNVASVDGNELVVIKG